jgi:hypothetical protein
LTEAEAIEKARHEADARLWPWIEPIKVKRKRAYLVGPKRWRVQTNGTAIGLHVIVVMDDTGRVLSANVLRY